MTQFLSQVKNPWGAAADQSAPGLDPQRSDLFTIDFSPPLLALRGILQRVVGINGDGDDELGDPNGVAAALLDALPSSADLPYFPNGVEFPERRVRVDTSRRHEIAYPFPGYDEECAPVVVTWTLDSGVADVSPRAHVLALLRTWLAVVRAGRDGQDPNELTLDLATASASGRGFIPHFRHDFTVYLWRGQSTPPTEAAFTSAATPNDAGLVLSQKWLVRRAWLGGLQLPPLRHAQAGVSEVRATFYADTVVEI